MIHQRLHSYENAGSHSYITNGFQVTVFFQFLETQYKTDDSRQPDKRENSPSPTACVPHDEQCKRGVRPRNMQIDRSVIEFAKQFLQLTRTAAVIPGGADIRRQHAKQVDGYTSYRPLRFDTRRRFREQDISGYDSKQYTCSVTERVRPFFDVIVSFIFQCFLSALVSAAKVHFYFFLKARVIFFLIGWVFFLNQFSFDEGGADSRSALIDFIKNSFI